jgi:hypothetical protein
VTPTPFAGPRPRRSLRSNPGRHGRLQKPSPAVAHQLTQKWSASTVTRHLGLALVVASACRVTARGSSVWTSRTHPAAAGPSSDASRRAIGCRHRADRSTRATADGSTSICLVAVLTGSGPVEAASGGSRMAGASGVDRPTGDP